MALIKCPDCGADVSDAAAACPKCARPIAAQVMNQAAQARRSPAAKSKHLSGGSVLFVFIFLGLVIYYFANDSDAPESPKAAAATSTQQEAEQADHSAVVTATPSGLYQAYRSNEVATDQLLAGKIIQVTAPVKSIDKDFTDSAVLHFATGDEFGEMGVTLDDSQKPRAATLSRGQIVTVQCKKMQRILNSPMGNDCIFVDKPSPAAR